LGNLGTHEEGTLSSGNEVTPSDSEPFGVPLVVASAKQIHCAEGGCRSRKRSRKVVRPVSHPLVSRKRNPQYRFPQSVLALMPWKQTLTDGVGFRLLWHNKTSLHDDD
jgi:hypothetical protein